MNNTNTITNAGAATTAQDEITAINAAHWAEDYNAAVLPRDSHLRQRLARRIPSHLSGRVCMGEYGPCGKFGIKLDEQDFPARTYCGSHVSGSLDDRNNDN